MTHSRPVCIEIDPNSEQRLLEAVRQQYGLETLDQAAEYLSRRRIRNGMRRIAGPRTLKQVR